MKTQAVRTALVLGLLQVASVGLIPNSQQILEALREAHSNPEAIENLRQFPFENVYLRVRSYDVYGNPEVVLPGRRALQLWPDWPERIWQRTEKILRQAQEAQRDKTLDRRTRDELDYAARTECSWVTQFLRSWPTPEVVRILGPMLMEPGEQIIDGDHVIGAPWGFALHSLRDLKRLGLELPGSPEGSNLEAWRAWWQANKEKYMPAPSVPPVQATAAPSLPNSPTQAADTTPSATENEQASGPAAANATRNVWRWPIAAVIALAGVGAAAVAWLLMRRSKRARNTVER